METIDRLIGDTKRLAGATTRFIEDTTRLFMSHYLALGDTFNLNRHDIIRLVKVTIMLSPSYYQASVS